MNDAINPEKDALLIGVTDRFKEARVMTGLSQAALAKVSRIGERQVQRMESGEQNPSIRVLAALANKGINVGWILTGDGLPTIKDDVIPGDDVAMDDKDFVLVPRFDISASAGTGEWVEDERVVDHLAFRRDWVRRSLGVDPAQLALISATGDSMEPTIRAGDLLLVHTGIDRFQDDAIYVVSMANRILVKRVQCFFNGAVIVRSDNPSYVEQTLSPEDAEQIRVNGRVVWIARMV